MGVFKSFVRLGLIAVSALIVGVIVLFSLRQVGLSIPSPISANPLLKSSFLLLTRGDTDRAPLFSEAGFRAAAENPDAILVADLRPTRDLKWVVYGRAALEEHTTGQGPVERLTLDEVLRLKLRVSPEDTRGDQPILSLAQFLDRFANRKLAFVIHSRESVGTASLLDDLKARSEVAETLVMSPYHSMIRELRRQRPSWVFASDPATMSKFRFMAGLYIETVAEMWPDIMLTPLRVTKTLTVSPRLADEFERRKKPLVIESNGEEEIPAYLRHVMRGILTSRAGWATSSFADHLKP